MDEFMLMLRACLLGIFAPAALTKVLNLRSASSGMAREIVPASLAMPATVLLTGVELVLCGVLILQIAPGVTFLVGALLFGLFVVTGARARRSGDALPCGCLGGVADLRVGTTSIYMNAGMVLACCLGAVSSAGQQSFTSDAAVVVAASGALLALLYWSIYYVASVVQKADALARSRA